MKNPSVTLALAGIAGASAFSRPVPAAEVGYYAQPALHGDTMVFGSEGDLWITDLSGTPPLVAWRLTSGDGVESHPVIDPDGKSVAFAGAYGGNTDIYVIPIDGGQPRRLTFHPDPDRPLAWTRDGARLVFRSPRAHPHGRDEAWLISRVGGMPRREPYGMCTMLAHSASGRRIAMTPHSNETRHWKGYRGGTAPDIWVGDPSSGAFRRLTEDDASDLHPMWVGGRVYFLSDRSGSFNLHSDRPEGGDLRQHTHFARDEGDPTAVEGYDARWASADASRGGQRIAFAQAGGLVIFDTSDETLTRLDVRIASDRVTAQERHVEIDAATAAYALAPDASAVVVGSRGELVYVDVPSGAAHALTRTSGAREWGASWFDGERVICISDGAGEQQIAIVHVDDAAGARLVTDDRNDWLLPPAPSPDHRWIAFSDQTMRLHALDTETLERHEVDRAEAGEITDYRFSPDGRWLAYAKPLANGNRQIVLHALRSRRNTALGDGSYDESSPCWSPDGHHLFYLSRRHFDPMLGTFDFEHVFARTSLVYALPLERTVPPPIPELERAARSPEEQDTDPAEADVVAAIPDDEELGILVDTDELAIRATRLRIPPGNYSRLRAQDGAVTFLEQPDVGLIADTGARRRDASVRRFDLQKETLETIIDGVASYDVSADGTHLVAVDAEGPLVRPLAKGDVKRFALDGIRLRIDARAEWTQLFEESWRLQRDFFWAPGLGGIDWEAMKVKYAAVLPRVGSRREVNDVVGEMVGELRTSHARASGGAFHAHETTDTVSVGLLGIDVAVVNGRHRIESILPRHDWDDALESPLAMPHVGVSAGEVILAVNGRPLGPGDNLFDALQGQADQIVTLELAGADGRSRRRSVRVRALASERAMRYMAWVDANRAYVAERSGGQAGYIHIPDMGGPGLAMFGRQFYAQSNARALVIDVRDNGGGFVSQMIIARLGRALHGFMQPRHGVTARYPYRAVHAHRVAIVDEMAGSDGDIFAAVFRAAELGPLIGTRTWGGVVGIRADKPAIDLGMTTQPEFAWWDLTGWSIENVGVRPDIEVVISPQDRALGVDPQLERAIDEINAALARDPMELPDHPPYPR